jgi:WD40 repeat protein
MSYVISVGWDRHVYVWPDTKENDMNYSKKLPRKEQKKGHEDDIMSVAHSQQDNLIFTGGHDGSLLAWNFETGYIKDYLHDNDASCLSRDALNGKSVDSVRKRINYPSACDNG